MKIKHTILTVLLAALCVGGCDKTDITPTKPIAPALPKIELPFEVTPMEVTNADFTRDHLRLLAQGRKYLDDNKITNYTGIFAKQENLGGLTPCRSPTSFAAS